MLNSTGLDDCFYDAPFKYVDDIDDALEYLEEELEETEGEEDHLEYKQLKWEIDSGKTLFVNMREFYEVFRLRELEPGKLYYEWEGDYIDFWNNIIWTGEPREYYDTLSDEERIDILKNIDEHIV